MTVDVHYVRNDHASIAYQVLGEGPIDLVCVPGFVSNLVWNWKLPPFARFLKRLSGFARVVIMDRRGVGLSDRFSPQDLPPLEVLVDDLLTVIDAAGCKLPALLLSGLNQQVLPSNSSGRLNDFNR